MKLSKNELLEILTEVIKHDYCLGKLGTILEIIDAYEPLEIQFLHHRYRELLIDDDEEPCSSKSSSKSSSSASSCTTESTTAIFLTEGEESE